MTGLTAGKLKIFLACVWCGWEGSSEEACGSSSLGQLVALKDVQLITRGVSSSYTPWIQIKRSYGKPLRFSCSSMPFLSGNSDQVFELLVSAWAAYRWRIYVSSRFHVSSQPTPRSSLRIKGNECGKPPPTAIRGHRPAALARRAWAGAVAFLLLGLVVQFLGRLVYPSTSLKERFLGAWNDARSALNESQRWPLEDDGDAPSLSASTKEKGTKTLMEATIDAAHSTGAHWCTKAMPLELEECRAMWGAMSAVLQTELSERANKPPGKPLAHFDSKIFSSLSERASFELKALLPIATKTGAAVTSQQAQKARTGMQLVLNELSHIANQVGVQVAKKAASARNDVDAELLLRLMTTQHLHPESYFDGGSSWDQQRAGTTVGSRARRAMDQHLEAQSELHSSDWVVTWRWRAMCAMLGAAAVYLLIGRSTRSRVSKATGGQGTTSTQEQASEQGQHSVSLLALECAERMQTRNDSVKFYEPTRANRGESAPASAGAVGAIKARGSWIHPQDPSAAGVASSKTEPGQPPGRYDSAAARLAGWHSRNRNAIPQAAPPARGSAAKRALALQVLHVPATREPASVLSPASEVEGARVWWRENSVFSVNRNGSSKTASPAASRAPSISSAAGAASRLRSNDRYPTSSELRGPPAATRTLTPTRMHQPEAPPSPPPSRATSQRRSLSNGRVRRTVTTPEMTPTGIQYNKSHWYETTEAMSAQGGAGLDDSSIAHSAAVVLQAALMHERKISAIERSNSPLRMVSLPDVEKMRDLLAAATSSP